MVGLSGRKNPPFDGIRLLEDRLLPFAQAERTGISISGYIAELLRRNQALETLMAGESNVNVATDAKRKTEKRLNQKIRTDPAGFEPATPGLEDVRFQKEGTTAPIEYRKVREEFATWMYSRCTKKHAKEITTYLNKNLTETIRDPRQLFRIVDSVTKGKRHTCMGVRDLLKFYDVFSLMDEVSLSRYRKVVQIPPTKVDEYIPETEKIVSAFLLIKDDRYKLFSKLLAFSGIRLTEADYLFSHFEAKRIITNGEVARYPLHLDRKTKRSFYAYFPAAFASELKKMKLKEENAKSYITHRMPSKYIRKWQYNFLISSSVPESVADFIQGRAPSTVGSMHYLAKVKQADEWYAKVVPQLLSLFPSENTYASHSAAE